MFPASRVAAMLSLFLFVSDFHRVGLGRFLIRVNHDSSVENANYGGLGLLLPSLFVLLKQIEDLFHCLHALLHIQNYWSLLYTLF